MLCYRALWRIQRHEDVSVFVLLFKFKFELEFEFT